MKYLESAIKFLIKNWMLALPLFILTALAFLLNSGAAYQNLAMLNNTGVFKNVPVFGSLLPSIMANITPTGGLWLYLSYLLSFPITYGLVNKYLETGTSGLNETGQALSSNFVKCLMYFIGFIVVGICAVIAIIIISLLTAALSLIPILGALLAILIMLAMAVALVVLTLVLSFWLSAMIVDGLDVIAAAKKSIEVARSCFWTLLGITILVGIACLIVGWILGRLTFIPLLGPIIASLVPSAQTFVMAVFFLLIYREKTGRVNSL